MVVTTVESVARMQAAIDRLTAEVRKLEEELVVVRLSGSTGFAHDRLVQLLEYEREVLAQRAKLPRPDRRAEVDVPAHVAERLSRQSNTRVTVVGELIGTSVQHALDSGHITLHDPHVEADGVPLADASIRIETRDAGDVHAVVITPLGRLDFKWEITKTGFRCVEAVPGSRQKLADAYEKDGLDGTLLEDMLNYVDDAGHELVRLLGY